MRLVIGATAALLLIGGGALANEFERVPPVTDAATRKECRSVQDTCKNRS
ncbi:hypothetical protein M5E06_35285 [Azospirillum sp. A1-3]|nr:hypothetical protein [Azospirillum sp. A1-3]MCM8739341.1 hypothetical protein [Azospirillum sp. A1-3]